MQISIPLEKETKEKLPEGPWSLDQVFCQLLYSLEIILLNVSSSSNLEYTLSCLEIAFQSLAAPGQTVGRSSFFTSRWQHERRSWPGQDAPGCGVHDTENWKMIKDLDTEIRPMNSDFGKNMSFI